MVEEKPRPIRFGEALGPGVNSAFNSLRSEIMKDGALSSKDKALIALACAVAIPCESCVEFHKKVAGSTGATREEMLEAAAIGGLVRVGSGFSAAFMVIEDEKK
jgi:AhpD family alkylhydroperoxidase